MTTAGTIEKLVLDDVNGVAREEDADTLRADEDSVREWLAVLTRMSQDIDAALAQIRADVEQRRQDCLATGPKGKDRFFSFKAQREEERAALIKQKAAIVERMKEARDLLHVFAQDDDHKKHDRLNRIEAKIDAATDLLKQILEKVR